MITRRNLLSSLVAAAGASTLPAGSVFAGQNTGQNLTGSSETSSKNRRIPWRNWSGSQTCFPQARKAPGTLGELQDIIASAKGCVRPVGSGHSFTSLVPTEDTILSVSRMSGVVSHDASNNTAVIQAGTRLGDIGGPLAEVGQAMINMPDIDEQTLAGALGTATHGTGAGIGCLPTFVEGIQLVTATGDVLECDRYQNADIFNAARVNLGALGVVTQVKLQNMPKYRLKREISWHSIEDILENAEALADANRNYEFYYIPFSGMGFHDIQNITEDPAAKSEKLDQNDGAETLKDLRDWLSWSPKLRQLILSTYMKTIDKEVTVANSWQNYASERNVRFNEMEYHLPRENGIQAFKEIRAVVEKNFSEVFFPFEVRFIQSDDIWMSPFYQRETMSIAVHRFFEEDYKPLFKAVEPIMKKYNGRPHWGKINTLTADQLQPHYQHWNAFKSIRQQLDPTGKFLNPYLKTLFNVA